MFCALLFITSSPDFPFTKIYHTFMVSGYSFLHNDRDFGSIETARRKQQHLYVPHQWYNLICTARQKNPFTYCIMERKDFVSLDGLKK